MGDTFDVKRLSDVLNNVLETRPVYIRVEHKLYALFVVLDRALGSVELVARTEDTAAAVLASMLDEVYVPEIVSEKEEKR